MVEKKDLIRFLISIALATLLIYYLNGFYVDSGLIGGNNFFIDTVNMDYNLLGGL